MSGQHDQEQTRNGGKEKQERGKNVAQEVEATTSIVHGNVSKHAEEEDGFWTTRPTTGKKSKLFGIRGIPDNQKDKEEDLDLTLSEGELTDEDMEKAAPHWPANKEWAGAMRILNMSPTPAGGTAQPANKKRRFSAIPSTPVRPRVIGVGRDKAMMANVAALYTATKEILQQGKAAEAMAMAGWKRVEEETEVHKQGIISMFDRITTIQTDFRKTAELRSGNRTRRERDHRTGG